MRETIVTRPERAFSSKAHAAMHESPAGKMLADRRGYEALVDLALNVGGFDDGLLKSADLNMIRFVLREYRDQARAALDLAGRGRQSPMMFQPFPEDPNDGGQ